MCPSKTPYVEHTKTVAGGRIVFLFDENGGGGGGIEIERAHTTKSFRILYA